MSQLPWGTRFRRPLASAASDWPSASWNWRFRHWQPKKAFHPQEQFAKAGRNSPSPAWPYWACSLWHFRHVLWPVFASCLRKEACWSIRQKDDEDLREIDVFIPDLASNGRPMSMLVGRGRQKEREKAHFNARGTSPQRSYHPISVSLTRSGHHGR